MADDLQEASAILDRVVLALNHRDVRRACPRPCPDKKANKGKKRNEPKHVCELVPGDGMTPLERMRNAHPAQIKAQRYDRAGGRPSGKSDPTGELGRTLAARKGPDDETAFRDHFAKADRHLGIALLLERAGTWPKEAKRHAKLARNAAHQCDLIVMRWGPPRPPSTIDLREVSKGNATPLPDCQSCGRPVELHGWAALETDAGGNLPEKGPTCDFCVRILKRTGKKPTKKMINDNDAGRRVRLPDTNHVEAT